MLLPLRIERQRLLRDRGRRRRSLCCASAVRPAPNSAAADRGCKRERSGKQGCGGVRAPLRQIRIAEPDQRRDIGRRQP